MRFPLDNSIFQFLYWLVDTPGLGGLFVGLVVVIFMGAAGSALRWIARGALADEPETYSYPTPALHEH
jgi:hypothetical protein